MNKTFNDNFIYSKGDRVNVLTILKKYNLVNDDSIYENFKDWIIENQIIELPFEIEKDGRNTYLKDYKEKVQVKFSESVKNKSRGPSSPTASVGSRYSSATTLPEDLMNKMTILESKFDKKIKEEYEILHEKREKTKAENIELKKELENLKKELESKNKKILKLKSEKKYNIKNPENFFDKLKEEYPKIVDIEIKTQPKKNKMRMYIENGEFYKK